MKPAAFTYHAPASLEEAVALLARFGAQDGRILAGGQSLVPTMAFRMATPAHLIDINGIAELAEWTESNETGALSNVTTKLVSVQDAILGMEMASNTSDVYRSPTP